MLRRLGVRVLLENTVLYIAEHRERALCHMRTGKAWIGLRIRSV